MARRAQLTLNGLDCYASMPSGASAASEPQTRKLVRIQSGGCLTSISPFGARSFSAFQIMS